MDGNLIQLTETENSAAVSMMNTMRESGLPAKEILSMGILSDGLPIEI